MSLTPREIAKRRINAALKRLGLNEDETATEMLTAYTNSATRGRVNLGQHRLVDICLDRAQIMKAAEHFPHTPLHYVWEARGPNGKPDKRSRILGYDSSSIEVELNGVHLGTVREDGIFVSTTRDADDYLGWIEATGSDQPHRIQKVEHRGRTLKVPSRELVVIAYAGVTERERQYKLRLPTLVNLNPRQQEAHA